MEGSSISYSVFWSSGCIVRGKHEDPCPPNRKVLQIVIHIRNSNGHKYSTVVQHRQGGLWKSRKIGAGGDHFGRIFLDEGNWGQVALSWRQNSVFLLYAHLESPPLSPDACDQSLQLLNIAVCIGNRTPHWPYYISVTEWSSPGSFYVHTTYFQSTRSVNQTARETNRDRLDPGTGHIR